MEREVAQKLVKLADSLDKQGMRTEADQIDQILVTAGIMDAFSRLMDKAKMETMKKSLEAMKALVSKAPEKVAEYLLKLRSWINGLKETLTQAQSKKASLLKHSKLDKMNVAIVLLVLNLISSLAGNVIHVLESQKKAQPQQQESVMQQKEKAEFLKGTFVKNLTTLKKETEEIKKLIKIGPLELPLTYVNFSEKYTDETSSKTENK